jgi:hypothetical protein
MTMNRRTFMQAAGLGVVGAGLGMTRAGWAFHNSGLPTIQPSYGDIAGVQILGYTDMSFPPGSGHGANAGNWDQTYEFRVIDTPRGRFAYCGNGGNGWSIVDVSNPRNLRVVHRHPHSTLPDNTQYIDIKGGNIMVVKRNRRLENWDVSNPSAPVLLGTFTPADIHPTANAPFHGLWVHEDRRGRFAFAACAIAGFTDMIVLCVDINDPRNPKEVSRFWYPGMNTNIGEVPTWPSTGLPDRGLPAPTVQCHDITAYGDRLYCAWRDKGLIILDISDIRNLKMVGEINWADGRPNFPSLPGQTHSMGIVIPNDGGPPDYVIATDELGQCPFGYPHILDVRDETRPEEVSGFRLPLNLHGNCPPDRSGRRMGVHDVERMIRGDIVWSAWEEGGFWGIDISDLHHPRPVAYYVPPVRSDSPATSRSGHADDVFVMDDGIVFGSSSDQGAGGLWAMRQAPALRGTVAWNAAETDVIVTRTDQPRSID